MTLKQFHRLLALLALMALTLLLLVGLAAAQLPPVTLPPGGGPADPDKKEYVTAFTPNGDGINDLFAPHPTIQQYSIQVYDRWGNAVFTGNQRQSWDGRKNDQTDAPEGVYIYRMKALTTTGDTLQHIGTVTLLR